MNKPTHWRTREYHNFLKESAKTEFVWGVSDCALFCADGIKAITGVDIAVDFRGKYHSEEEAFELIKTLTGGTTIGDAAAYCAKQHGLPEWNHPLLAQRGDLVVIPNAGRLISGLVHLDGRHVACQGDGGMKLLPITDIQRSWHI